MKCEKALCYVKGKEPLVIFDDLERNGMANLRYTLFPLPEAKPKEKSAK